VGRWHLHFPSFLGGTWYVVESDTIPPNPAEKTRYTHSEHLSEMTLY